MKYIVWKNNRISNFVLGTAQLGMDYGIANVQGQPTEEQACEIVETACANGVNCFDTGQAYGNSEIVLGKSLKHCGAISEAKIVSKLLLKQEPFNSKSVEQSIERSRQNLGVDRLWCLMLHEVGWLDIWGEGLGQTLAGIRKRGIVKYLGVTVYWPEEARRALEHADIQIIQVPCNAWDQRMKSES